jgi:putative ABC transport system ATP-binding protein
MNAVALVTAVGVGRRWPDGGGLSPVDFELRRGRITVVRGRSGSGKSTLLAILAGWCDVTSGEVRRDPAADPARWSGVAIVPQTLGLVAELSIAENVDMPLRLAGAPDAERRAAVHEALHALDLVDLAQRLPAEVSLGQQQRTALARATVGVPALLLVDEPTSHQDAGHASAAVDALRRTADAGAAVLVATHDEVVVDRADDVIDLDIR